MEFRSVAGDGVPVARDDVWLPKKRETEGFRTLEMELRSPEIELKPPEMWREFDFSRLFGWMGEKPQPFLFFSH
ncbi:hypothetical protein RHMOL_Rhmol08G0065000 [Rhododendron molle]|uniref:Uncharacterized protein n=1 Tax=Rhododendron molle TaxID=49168 RepID=A0ACC0MLJ7_RHOML|nr:hypothetical protein RHMOL_Rhmol08G0065000 [Rhododendron molle]